MAKIRTYKDFKLLIQDYKESSGSFRVTLNGKDFGDYEANSKLKLDNEDIAANLGRIQDGLRQDRLITLGKVLAKSLFPKELTPKFIAAVKACGNGEGVRLRLVIEDVALQQVPWEFTYLKMVEGVEDHTHFLALTPKVSIVRHPLMGEPVEPLHMPDPSRLKLLPVFAQPSDQDTLDLKKEKEVLKESLAGLPEDIVKVKLLPFVENTTFFDLQKALLKKPEMFHFAGHGVFESDSGSLILLADKKDKLSAPLPASELGSLLAGSDVRLAYLGACLTSRVEGNSPWTSIANRVVAAGVPAVLAMQYEVKDTAATQFCRAFYTTLAAGLTVDEAVTAGRQAVLNNSGTGDQEWGFPTLYLRAENGVLFKEATEAESDTAESIRVQVDLLIKRVEAGGSVIGLNFTEGVQPGDFGAKIEVDTVRGGTITGVVIGGKPKRNGGN